MNLHAFLSDRNIAYNFQSPDYHHETNRKCTTEYSENILLHENISLKNCMHSLKMCVMKLPEWHKNLLHEKPQTK